MRGWFARLSIHRKLVVMALAVSATALVAAIVTLTALDASRFRSAAVDDTRALADVIAENSAAALVFGDANAARDTLASVHVRPTVALACLYQADGRLLATYARRPRAACPRAPHAFLTWRAVGAMVPVVRAGARVGTAFVERDLSDVGARIGATAAVGGGMLVVASAIALVLAERLQRIVSRPVVDLAAATRAMGLEQDFALPRIDAPPDEVGDLVRAFEGMLTRVRDARAELVESNRALRRENDERRRVEEALRREIEERRRVEAERETLLVREREASRLKDEFLAAVSHELRTPLNAILGWTQILASTPPSEQTFARAVASLARNAQAQTRVVDDLIDVSRVVTGKLHLRLAAVDLRTVVDGAIEVIRPAATAKNLPLAVDLPPFACMVQGDRDRLRQIVWNLLSNAVKFTPAGGRIGVHLTSARGSYELTVQDTGSGIAPEFLPHVFDRFRQADGSMARQHGGLGLGLAIVKDLAELHGGSVAASSAGPGGGAEFTVRLPHLVGVEADETPTAPERPLPRLDGVRILAVDDNADALDVLSITLARAGARVRTARSAADGLAAWQDETPDLLICDLGMPQTDGFELLEQVRASEAGRLTPAIAVTAYASEGDRERCLRAGFRAHLVKPFETAVLVGLVAEVLERV